MKEKIDAILGGACLVVLFLLVNFLPELVR